MMLPRSTQPGSLSKTRRSAFYGNIVGITEDGRLIVDFEQRSGALVMLAGYTPSMADVGKPIHLVALVSAKEPREFIPAEMLANEAAIDGIYVTPLHKPVERVE